MGRARRKLGKRDEALADFANCIRLNGDADLQERAKKEWHELLGQQ